MQSMVPATDFEKLVGGGTVNKESCKQFLCKKKKILKINMGKK